MPLLIADGLLVYWFIVMRQISITEQLYKGEKNNLDTSLSDEENHPITVWSANKLPSELKKARGKPQWSSLSSGKSEQAQLLRTDTAWSLSGKLQSYKRES